MIHELDDLPKDRGAYLLLIHLIAPVELSRRFQERTLAAGRYGYAGSARGPGGIKARCRHHLSHDAKRHWHVDWVTSAAVDIHVITSLGGFECSIIKSLVGLGFVEVPVAGFGSSDCHRCDAHLVHFKGVDRWDDVLERLDPAAWLMPACRQE